MINVYCVYDKVSGVYNPPFVSENDESAKRSFFHACKSSPFGADFALYYVGQFGNNEDGAITPDFKFITNAPASSEVVENG